MAARACSWLAASSSQPAKPQLSPSGQGNDLFVFLGDHGDDGAVYVRCPVRVDIHDVDDPAAREFKCRVSRLGDARGYGDAHIFDSISHVE